MHKRDAYLEELVRINRSKGRLIPQEVVDIAREKSNPLHDRFQWDDSIAGENYRLFQARQLISFFTIIDGSNKEHKKWVSIPLSKPSGKQGSNRMYVSHEVVLQNDAYLDQIILEAIERMRYWLKVSKKYKELKGIINEEKLSRLEKKYAKMKVAVN